MMGHQELPQGRLFYTNINLEERIRSNHPLRVEFPGAVYHLTARGRISIWAMKTVRDS